ncbi:MAG: hypothetical protein JG718_17370 [Candidatus Thiothrix moscowensis]|nr:hypothetical protein [Candidatus Thiothrix moscowensis]
MSSCYFFGIAIGFILGLILKSCPDKSKEAYQKGMKAAYLEMKASPKYSKEFQAVIDAINKEKK